MSPPDLLYLEGFVPDADALFTLLVASVAWDERMKARKTATFGAPYDYSGMTYAATLMHPALTPVVERLAERLGFRPNNCLLNYYESGDATMGFHADSLEPLMAGTGVAIVSLGAERTLTFRYKRGAEDEFPYPLSPGSLLYMPPEIQRDWRHGVPKQPGAGARISLTFRQVKPPGDAR